MVKKINLVYDGRMLLNQLKTGNRLSRTGIFFVVYNVLKQFLNRPELNVSIYVPGQKESLRRALKELYPEYSEFCLRDFNRKIKIESSYFFDMQKNDGLEDWNNPEKSGRWTTERSSFSFFVGSDGFESINIKIKVNSVLPSVSKVVLRTSKRVLAELTPERVKKGIDVALSVSEIIDSRDVTIWIESIGASTPKDLGIGEDSRMLGIRVEDIFVYLDKRPVSWTSGYLKYLKNCYKNSHITDKRQFFKLKAFVFAMKLYLKMQKLFERKSEKLEDIDIFFSPCFAVPKEIAQRKEIQKYVILYDTLPYVTPKEYYPSHGWKFLFDLYKTLNRKDHYFCISENTKKDFLKYIKHLDKKKMKVTLLAAADYFYKCDDPKRIKQVFKKYNLPPINKYIFSLCTLDPRKNLVTPIRSFLKFIKKNDIKDLYFLLGGGQVSEYLQQIEDILKEYPKQRKNIIQLGYVDDEDLAPFLSNAQWDVYTPFYEGFGLPPLEAMQCGCPVIASNNSSLPEVVGDAGILIDCTSDEEHIKAYEKYYYDPKYCQKMAKKGYERSKTFSYEKMADIMVKEMIKNVKN